MLYYEGNSSNTEQIKIRMYASFIINSVYPLLYKQSNSFDVHVTVHRDKFL